MKNIHIALSLAIGFMFASCGGTKNPTNDLTLNGNPFQLIEKGNLTFSSTDAKGSGKFIYSKPNKESDNSYTFSIKLPENNSSVTLIANADKDLNNGVSITFKKLTNKLKVDLIVAGTSHDISSDFDYVDVSKDKIGFAIDVHDEDPAHIIIWEKNSSDHYHKKDAKYNSENKIKKGKANGKFWGFTLEKANLMSPKTGKAKDHHHNHS